MSYHCENNCLHNTGAKASSVSLRSSLLASLPKLPASQKATEMPPSVASKPLAACVLKYGSVASKTVELQ